MSKRISIFIVLFFCAAQNSAAINNQSGVEKVINANLELLIAETDKIKTSDSEKFKQNLASLVVEAENASVEQQEFIKYFQAYEFILDGDFEESQTQLISLFESATSGQIRVRTKATLANVQAISREYNKALINLDFAIESANQIGDKALINKISLISAIVYYQLDIYDMSQKYSELLVAAEPDLVMLCKGSVYLSRAELSLNISQDEQHINEIIENCNNVNETIYSGLLALDWINKNLDQAHSQKNDDGIKQQLEKVKSIEAEIDEFGYNNLIGFKDMILAKAYYFNHEIEKAVIEAEKSIQGSSKSGNTTQVIDALNILQQEALISNDFKKAYQLGNQINKAEREIYSEAKSKQMAYMTVKHNNLAKQIEIQQLIQNNQLLSLENKLSDETTKKQQLILLLIISFLLLLALWTLRIKRKHDYFKNVAEIDHLTQVFTRKAFEEKIKLMLADCESKNLTINLGIMDLDHFKSVNDRFGHLVGDWVLKQVILVCEEVANQDILVARLGGEEFCIVSPAITQVEMMQLMERMRAGIEQMDTADSGADFKITASFGISSNLQSGYHVSMLLTHADVALFEAKNNGRNQVVAFKGVA